MKYKLKRKHRKNIKMMYVFLVILVVLIGLSVGYASFSSNLFITGKISLGGNNSLIDKVVDTGDGLHKIDDDKYYFVGKNVDNYIKLMGKNNEVDSTIWRIIGIDKNGIKLRKEESIGNIAWNTKGSKVWADSSLNEKLNGDFYASLSNSINLNQLVQNPIWNIGESKDGISIYSNVEYQGTVDSAKPVGIITIEDYKYTGNSDGWMKEGNFQWTITAYYGNSTVYRINATGNSRNSNVTYESIVKPVIYLKANVKLKGSGKYDDPYIVVTAN